MSKHSSPSTSSNPQRDDAYWSSLFALEDHETVAASGGSSEGYDPDDLNARRDGQPASRRGDWEAAQRVYSNDEILVLPVTGYNKGGLLVVWKGLQGFVPASQLNDLPQFHIHAQRTQALRQRLDQQLSLRVIEVDPRSNRFILSERAASAGTQERRNIFDRLEPGQTFTGRVTNLTDFGAFVDLGGAEGLIHISELSWGRVMHPSDIVKPELEVTVLILSIDRPNKRIALSLKQVQPDPWLNVETRYQVGQLVEGTVNNVANFGAFVEVEKGLEGLVHISELAEGAFLHPRNVVRKGQQVKARVLNVDAKARRLALSMRDLDKQASE